MEKLTNLLAMGGYGGYIWPSFIITALAMLYMVVTSLRSLRKAQKSLAELHDQS